MGEQQKTYTATLRIPTREQYAFIEVVVEGTAAQIVSAYHEFTRNYKQSADARSSGDVPF